MTRRGRRFLSALMVAAALAAGCAPSAERECLYQVSTIGALIEGLYDGTVTIGNLKKHGDVGLSTPGLDQRSGKTVE